jgi:hypothetical protein
MLCQKFCRCARPGMTFRKKADQPYGRKRVLADFWPRRQIGNWLFYISYQGRRLPDQT